MMENNHDNLQTVRGYFNWQSEDGGQWYFARHEVNGEVLNTLNFNANLTDFDAFGFLTSILEYKITKEQYDAAYHGVMAKLDPAGAFLKKHNFDVIVRRYETEKTPLDLKRLRVLLQNIEKDGEANRAEQKRPHIDAGNAIQQFWKDALSPVLALRTKIDAELLAIGREEAANREKLLREEALAKAHLMPSMPAPPIAPLPTVTPPVAAVDLKVTDTFEVNDIVAAVTFFAEQPDFYNEIEAIVLKYARRGAKSGIVVPGITTGKGLKL